MTNEQAKGLLYFLSVVLLLPVYQQCSSYYLDQLLAPFHDNMVQCALSEEGKIRVTLLSNAII